MPICVTGMARSGTSLVSQLLHRAGVSFGPPDQLLDATTRNPEGFFENKQMIEINDRLLAFEGGSWFNPPLTAPQWRAASPIAQRAKETVARLAVTEPWAWKDPRNALTFSFWKEMLPGTKMILCVRHPVEAAASLAISGFFPRAYRMYWNITEETSALRLSRSVRVENKLSGRLGQAMRLAGSRLARRDFFEEVSIELWRIYNERALLLSDGSELLVTHFDAHFTRPRAELDRILRFIGINPTADILDRHARTASPQHRHHRAASAEVDDETRTLYERLCREADFPDEIQSIHG